MVSCSRNVPFSVVEMKSHMRSSGPRASHVIGGRHILPFVTVSLFLCCVFGLSPREVEFCLWAWPVGGLGTTLDSGRKRTISLPCSPLLGFSLDTSCVPSPEDTAPAPRTPSHSQSSRSGRRGALLGPGPVTAFLPLVRPQGLPPPSCQTLSKKSIYSTFLS